MLQCTNLKQTPMFLKQFGRLLGEIPRQAAAGRNVVMKQRSQMEIKEKGR